MTSEPTRSGWRSYQIRMAIRFQLTGAWVVILPLVVLGVAPPWAGFVVSAALLVATWSMPYQPELQDYLMEDSR